MSDSLMPEAPEDPATETRVVKARPEPDFMMACVGCGIEIGRTRIRHAPRSTLFACDGCQRIIRRFVTAMKARGYPAVALFDADFRDVPGLLGMKAIGEGPRG